MARGQWFCGFVFLLYFLGISTAIQAEIRIISRPQMGAKFDIVSAISPPATRMGILPWKENIWASPTVDRSRRIIFTGSANHGLHAVDADSGKRLLFISTKGRVETQMTMHKPTGLMFFGSKKGVLYAYDAYSFKLIFEYDTDGPIQDNLIIVDDSILIFTTKTATVYAFDLEQKILKWKIERPSKQTRLKMASLSNILLYAHDSLGKKEKTVLVPHRDGYISFIDSKSGKVRQEVSLSSNTENILFPDIVAPMILFNDVLLCASYEEGVFKLDALTGQIQGHFSVKGVVQLKLYQEHVFALTSGRLFKLTENLQKTLEVQFSDLKTRRARYGYPFSQVSLGARRIFSGVPSGLEVVNNSLVFGMSQGGIAQFSPNGIFENLQGWPLGVGSKIDTLGKDVIAVTRNGWVIGYSPVSFERAKFFKKAGRFREIDATRRR